MADTGDRLRKLKKPFWENKVAQLPQLCAATGWSVRNVLRHLKAIGYHSSYNANSRYYTLEGIPDFDADGLWRCSDAWFSRYGTLRRTVQSVVGCSQAGLTARQLRQKLHVRVDQRLPVFVHDGDIVAHRQGRSLVYYSTQQSRRTVQESMRNGAAGAGSWAELARDPLLGQHQSAVEVILVLTSKIQHPQWDARQIHEDLARGGMVLPLCKVEATFERLGLCKKNSGPKI
jgi:hypothetical protein